MEVGHLYTELNVLDKEKITINFRYRGTKNRELVVTSPSRVGFMRRQVCLVPEISIKHTHFLEDWRASSVDIASEICAEIFIQFQWKKPSFSSVKELSIKLLSKELLK